MAKVGKRFDPGAKRGRVVQVCEMWAGGRKFAKSVSYLFVVFLSFFFFCNHAFILGTKSIMQREL